MMFLIYLRIQIIWCGVAISLRYVCLEWNSSFFYFFVFLCVFLQFFFVFFLVAQSIRAIFQDFGAEIFNAGLKLTPHKIGIVIISYFWKIHFLTLLTFFFLFLGYGNFLSTPKILCKQPLQSHALVHQWIFRILSKTGSTENLSLNEFFCLNFLNAKFNSKLSLYLSSLLFSQSANKSYSWVHPLKHVEASYLLEAFSVHTLLRKIWWIINVFGSNVVILAP